MLVSDTCKVCRGNGTLEYEEELWFDGTWRRRVGGADPIWPVLTEARPDIARYTEDDCEVCGGSGEYALEVFNGVSIF